MKTASDGEWEDHQGASALTNISSKFLIEHVNHAFFLRSNVKMVKNLSFEDFCEFILPFQSCYGRNIRKTNAELYDFFKKYASNVTKENIPDNIDYLNLTIGNLRLLLGDYPLPDKNGFEELFFNNRPKWDCFDYSNFQSAILRAIGIPVGVYNNVGYKMLQGRHSSCAIPETIGEYTMFSLDSKNTVPTSKVTNKLDYNGSLNIYQATYARNPQSPSALKAPDEEVPPYFENQHLKDVSSRQFDVQNIEIPFGLQTVNRLAYLATHDSSSGLYSVTWGIIDRKTSKIVFNNVIPDRLYFPVIYRNGEYFAFGKAFYLSKTGNYCMGGANFFEPIYIFLLLCNHCDARNDVF